MRVELRLPEGITSVEVMYMMVVTDSGNFIISGASDLDIKKDNHSGKMVVFPESSNHIIVK